MSYRDEIKTIIDATRARLTTSSVEFYFFLMSAFATLGMIFRILDRMGDSDVYGELELHEIFGVFALISLALAIGILIFLTAMLSIYYDENFRLENETIYSSNFIFTRLATPILRALILLASLTLLVFSLKIAFFS